MKFNTLYSFVIFSIFIFSCNYSNKGKDKIQSWYVKAEIYCFCLDEYYPNNQTFHMACSTPATVHAYTLIQPESLFYSTNDTMIIKRLKKVFFDKREKTDTLTQASDARFVVLLKKNDLSADTLVFDREYSFNYNEKY